MHKIETDPTDLIMFEGSRYRSDKSSNLTPTHNITQPPNLLVQLPNMHNWQRMRHLEHFASLATLSFLGGGEALEAITGDDLLLAPSKNITR